MHDDLISQARRVKLWRGAVEDLAAHLPTEVDETTRLLDGLVAARDNEAFTPLLLAALHAAQPGDTSTRAGGIPFVAIPWRSHGILQ